MTDDALPPPVPGVAGLVLVPTPLGNLGDLSARALAVLRGADLLVCEDSRVTGKLFAALGVAAPRMWALHDHNEEAVVPGVLERLRAGAVVALCSDAGTPLVSDPGFRLVRAAIGEGVPVSALPGPNAAVTALVLSGLPPLPFAVLGFLPPRAAARRAALLPWAPVAATLVFYEAPHRVAEMLTDAAAVLGDRAAALARELTKRFEEVRRGRLSALAAGCGADPPRGEICVVVGPPEGAVAVDLDELLRAALGEAGVKEAVARVAALTGQPRRTVYARALALRDK